MGGARGGGNGGGDGGGGNGGGLGGGGDGAIRTVCTTAGVDMEETVTPRAAETAAVEELDRNVTAALLAALLAMATLAVMLTLEGTTVSEIRSAVTLKSVARLLMYGA